jgi:transcriptional regulator with XRE-family HTH domain
MPPAATPGARFAAARGRAGLTQAEVARRLGLTPQRISDVEVGHRPATPQWCLWAAAVLGWPPGDLDPGLAGLGAPLDRIALEAHEGRYRPASAADAARLARLAWPAGPVPAADLGALAAAAARHGLAVVLLARPQG